MHALHDLIDRYLPAYNVIFKPRGFASNAFPRGCLIYILFYSISFRNARYPLYAP